MADQTTDIEPARKSDFQVAGEVMADENFRLGISTTRYEDPYFRFELEHRIRHELTEAEKKRFKNSEALWQWMTWIGLFVAAVTLLSVFRLWPHSLSKHYLDQNAGVLMTYLLVSGCRSWFARDKPSESSGPSGMIAGAIGLWVLHLEIEPVLPFGAVFIGIAVALFIFYREQWRAAKRQGPDDSAQSV